VHLFVPFFGDVEVAVAGPAVPFDPGIHVFVIFRPNPIIPV